MNPSKMAQMLVVSLFLQEFIIYTQLFYFGAPRTPFAISERPVFDRFVQIREGYKNEYGHKIAKMEIAPMGPPDNVWDLIFSFSVYNM